MGPTIIKKEVLIGALTALIASVLGVFLFLWGFIKGDLLSNLEKAYEYKELGKIIGIGSLPNLAIFFIFLKINRFYRARGVLLYTILLAFCVMFLNFATG